jgi:hypothetical protein
MQTTKEPTQLQRREIALARLLINLGWLEPEERRAVAEAALLVLDGLPRQTEEAPGVVVGAIGLAPSN